MNKVQKNKVVEVAQSQVKATNEALSNIDIRNVSEDRLEAIKGLNLKKSLRHTIVYSLKDTKKSICEFNVSSSKVLRVASNFIFEDVKSLEGVTFEIKKSYCNYEIENKPSILTKVIRMMLQAYNKGEYTRV